ncbi:hypothetical protein [Variovorax terrae]|uniref:Uncharacterized protein n=1 Tax=Variovorax terrae TaxID=2923278 RepID=A0A9X1VSF8_9BURK|nr:hypothetical protein [Variovorax terrae]MCJ0762204.1 hypothetical protein [Variovorax terrae]
MRWMLMAGALCGAPAWGAGPEPAESEAQCRSEVSRFEQAIGFVRQTSGNAAAAQLKEKLLPAKLEGDILAQGGYCGLARHLRDKKLSQQKLQF